MAYNEFAYIYDTLMKDVNYKDWCDYLIKIFSKHGCNPKTILELACGTGNITTQLLENGYDVIGLDSSCDMLSVLKDKVSKDTLLLNQDMTNFELYGTVDCVLCLMDAINYVASPSSLLHMFKLVHNYLNDDGLFIFDIRSPYIISNVMGNNTFFEEDESILYVWNNQYDNTKKTCKLFLTFFVQSSCGLYEKFSETHIMRNYSVKEISSILKDSRLELLGTYDNLSFKKYNNKSERIIFVSKKNSC